MGLRDGLLFFGAVVSFTMYLVRQSLVSPKTWSSHGWAPRLLNLIIQSGLGFIEGRYRNGSQSIKTIRSDSVMLQLVLFCGIPFRVLHTFQCIGTDDSLAYFYICVVPSNLLPHCWRYGFQSYQETQGAEENCQIYLGRRHALSKTSITAKFDFHIPLV